MAEYLGAERCFLNILNRENEHIYMEAAYGVNNPVSRHGPNINSEKELPAKVVQMARPVVVEKISKSSLFLNRTNQELYKDGKELTFVCVPVIDEGKVTGTLSFARVYNPYISFDEDTRLLVDYWFDGGIRAALHRQERLEELETLKQKNLELESRDIGAKTHEHDR